MQLHVALYANIHGTEIQNRNQAYTWNIDIYIIEIKHIVISIEVRTARGANEQLLHDCSPASSSVLIDFPHHYI